MVCRKHSRLQLSAQVLLLVPSSTTRAVSPIRFIGWAECVRFVVKCDCVPRGNDHRIARGRKSNVCIISNHGHIELLHPAFPKKRNHSSLKNSVKPMSFTDFAVPCYQLVLDFFRWFAFGIIDNKHLYERNRRLALRLASLWRED